MRIGIGLWLSPVDGDSTAPVPPGLAERVGLDSLWLSEHHAFYDGYCPALLPAASGVLSATSQLRVGTGILLLPLQRPERVAAAAAELHRVSAGRFELGLGMGYRPIEFAAKDLRLADRRARMERATGVFRPEFDAPKSDRFIGNRDAALRTHYTL